MGGGNPDALLAYLCNHVPIVHFEDGRQRIAFVLQVVLLGDPRVGPFGPQPYTDLAILSHDPDAAEHHRQALNRFLEILPEGVTVTFVDGTSVTR